MKESVTYQAIVEEGWAKGRVEGLEKGIERGIEKGIEKGRIAQRREDVLKIGEIRLGKPSRKIRTAIMAISDADQLEMLLERTLDASSWNKLLAK